MNKIAQFHKVSFEQFKESWDDSFPGASEEEIKEVLQVEIPDNEYFNKQGITNYHGGANIVFDDESILEWIISHRKE